MTVTNATRLEIAVKEISVILKKYCIDMTAVEEGDKSYLLFEDGKGFIDMEDIIDRTSKHTKDISFDIDSYIAVEVEKSIRSNIKEIKQNMEFEYLNIAFRIDEKIANKQDMLYNMIENHLKNIGK